MIVYGEPDENVAVTVEPDDGTAVTVLDVAAESLVKVIVSDDIVVADTVKLVGADGAPDGSAGAVVTIDFNIPFRVCKAEANSLNLVTLAVLAVL